MTDKAELVEVEINRPKSSPIVVVSWYIPPGKSVYDVLRVSKPKSVAIFFFFLHEIFQSHGTQTCMNK